MRLLIKTMVSPPAHDGGNPFSGDVCPGLTPIMYFSGVLSQRFDKLVLRYGSTDRSDFGETLGGVGAPSSRWSSSFRPGPTKITPLPGLDTSLGSYSTSAFAQTECFSNSIQAIHMLGIGRTSAWPLLQQGGPRPFDCLPARNIQYDRFTWNKYGA